MPNVRVIKIVFDTELKTYEVPAFRGAIIDVVGREHVVFHNHIGDDQFHYKYPVIQYKTEGKKASIVCIKDGVDEIHHFFQNNTGKILIHGQPRSINVDSIKINKFELQVWDTHFRYYLKKWIPANSENYLKFQKIEGLSKQIQFLENILIGNILSMAKGLDWMVDKPIEVEITSIKNQFWTKMKKTNMMAFDIYFKTNVFLPFDIGLGKGSSMGFGTICKQLENKKL